jgi:ABC-2 type transport system permease protein
MRTILFLLQKEFIQIFRNRTMLPIIFLVPLVQMLVLVYAATLEMKSIDMVVVDKDLSFTSRRLASKNQGSPFFRINKSTFSVDEAENDLLENRSKVVLHIPAEFEQNLKRENKAEVQLLIDAVNGMTASLTNAYAQSLISDFNTDLLSRLGSNALVNVYPKMINVSYSYWYNPQLNFKYYMLPGILVILVSMIGLFLTALNLVREKETGTIEQINVTPIKKYQFITGKLVPFWVIAMFELGFGLLIGKLLFRLPILGSISLLYLFASIYLLVVLGLGLLISTLANSQQQVMFLTFFFLLTFILMSGIFTPAESMPGWAQKVNILNPFAYFMRVIRMIILKGSGFKDILSELISISAFGVIILSLAIWRYRKVA